MASPSQASHRLVTTTPSRFAHTHRRCLIAPSTSITHPLPFVNSRLATNPTRAPCPLLSGLDGGENLAVEQKVLTSHHSVATGINHGKERPPLSTNNTHLTFPRSCPVHTIHHDHHTSIPIHQRQSPLGARASGQARPRPLQWYPARIIPTPSASLRTRVLLRCRGRTQTATTKCLEETDHSGSPNSSNGRTCLTCRRTESSCILRCVYASLLA